MNMTADGEYGSPADPGEPPRSTGHAASSKAAAGGESKPLNGPMHGTEPAVLHEPARASAPVYRFAIYAVTFVVSVLVFWLLREQSFSGDYGRWLGFLGRGMWYRLREPVTLLIYRFPYTLLKPHGVSAIEIIAGFSYMCGGLSFCYILATLRMLTPDRRFQALGMAVFASSYGVVGIFFGHIEHYNLMSLGCFAYVYYALRYVKVSISIAAPALALGLLGMTHLMAAWMFPALVILPWLKPAEGPGEPNLRRRMKDLALALAVFGIPNIAMWVAILVIYYDSSIYNLLEDAATGRYTALEHQMPGNALGGGNRKGFWTLAEMLSWRHIREVVVLVFIYSPAAFILGIATLARSRREDIRRFLSEPAARLILALLIPYAVYVATWEAGLGAAQDWDLFSHIAIFLIYAVLILILVRGRSQKSLIAFWAAGVAVSAILSAYIVIETHSPDSPTGMAVILNALGITR